MTVKDCEELAKEIQNRFPDVECDYDPVTNNFDISQNALRPIRIPIVYWEALEEIAEAISNF